MKKLLSKIDYKNNRVLAPKELVEFNYRHSPKYYKALRRMKKQETVKEEAKSKRVKKTFSLDLKPTTYSKGLMMRIRIWNLINYLTKKQQRLNKGV